MSETTTAAHQGSYLQPEPLWLEPKAITSTAKMGMLLAAYGYGANNPLLYTDPDGLFIRHGDCPNWDSALALAKKWAGCDGSSSRSCGCEQAMGCNICPFLQDGSGPDAYIVDWGFFGNKGHTNVDGIYPRNFDHPGNSVAFTKRYCSNGLFWSNTEALAELMMHEAFHWCSKASGKVVRDTYGGAAGNGSGGADDAAKKSRGK